ncbi:sensor histidine kinase [Streptomyces sp. NBC_00289]|uniref:sensor histidine kinase n=1 Tax=Streptomyces sp. NBC_00289 TaxID=2975703 RepID=UPI00324D152E
MQAMFNHWRRWLAAHDRARDTLPAAVVLFVALWATAVPSDGHGWTWPRPAELGWITLACVPLVFRSRAPLVVAAVVTVLEVLARAATGTQALVPGASLVAVYTVASLRPRRTAWITAATVAVAVAATAVGVGLGDQSGVATSVLVRIDLVLLAAGLGDAVRSRRAKLALVEQRAVLAEQTREEEARRRVTEERVRIARELHDVVAHHITLVNAQAGVAQHLVRTDAEKAYRALGAIKETSRAALEELRATVGLLRQADDSPPSLAPAPGLEDLDGLVDGFRRTGMTVDVTRTGAARPLTPATGLAAYRIVQEALTNTHKHAGSATAHITLVYGPDTLRLTVADDGDGTARPGPGTGHGLIGMRERATAFGGTLTAGTSPRGGFRVHAELPLPAPKGNR